MVAEQDSCGAQVNHRTRHCAGLPSSSLPALYSSPSLVQSSKGSLVTPTRLAGCQAGRLMESRIVDYTTRQHYSRTTALQHSSTIQHYSTTALQHNTAQYSTAAQQHYSTPAQYNSTVFRGKGPDRGCRRGGLSGGCLTPPSPQPSTHLLLTPSLTHYLVASGSQALISCPSVCCQPVRCRCRCRCRWCGGLVQQGVQQGMQPG